MGALPGWVLPSPCLRERVVAADPRRPPSGCTRCTHRVPSGSQPCPKIDFGRDPSDPGAACPVGRGCEPTGVRVVLGGPEQSSPDLPSGTRFGLADRQSVLGRKTPSRIGSMLVGLDTVSGLRGGRWSRRRRRGVTGALVVAGSGRCRRQTGRLCRGGHCHTLKAGM